MTFTLSISKISSERIKVGHPVHISCNFLNFLYFIFQVINTVDKPGLQCFSCGSLLNPNKKCDRYTICLSVCLCMELSPIFLFFYPIYRSLHLSLCLLCLKIYLSVYLCFSCLSNYLSISLYICLFYLSICLLVYLTI